MIRRPGDPAGVTMYAGAGRRGQARAGAHEEFGEKNSRVYYIGGARFRQGKGVVKFRQVEGVSRPRLLGSRY